LWDIIIIRDSLNSIINSQSLKFYNIFKSGSNLNYESFEFDKSQILSAYRDVGYVNAKVSYFLEKSSLNNNILYFYIEEGQRFLIENLEFNFNDELITCLASSIRPSDTK